MKISKSKIPLYLYAICLFLWVLLYSLKIELGNDYAIVNDVYLTVWQIIKIVLILKIIVEARYIEIKVLLMIIVVLLLSYISYNATGYDFLFIPFLFLAGSNNIRVDDAVKIYYNAELVFLFIMLVLYFLGMTTDAVFLRESGRIRTSLGFRNPNQLSICLFQLSCAYLFLNRFHISSRKMAFPVFSDLFIILVPNSYTTGILLLLVIFSTMFLNWRKVSHITIKSKFNTYSIFRVLIIIGVVSIFAIAYIVIFKTSTAENFFGDMHQRVELVQRYFNYYKPKLWGQELITHYSVNYDWRTGLWTLDNAYAFLILGLGVVMTILYLSGLIILIINLFKNNKYIELIILAAYLASGLFETFLIRFIYNFTFLFLIPLIWKSKLNGKFFIFDGLPETKLPIYH